MVSYIIANWKMNEGKPNAEAYVKTIKREMATLPRLCTVVICPPFTRLSSLLGMTRGSRIKLGAQDVSSEPVGAFTGDVSASLVRDVGASYVIVGHSERRRFHNESEGTIRKKFKEVLAHEMTPILCIGETKNERTSGKTRAVLKRQLASALRGISLLRKRLIVAYEPEWAISTATKARPLNTELIPDMLKAVRLLTQSSTREVKKLSELLIVYGGSVDLHVARMVSGNRSVNGLLVGSASLNAKKFISIIKA